MKGEDEEILRTQVEKIGEQFKDIGGISVFNAHTLGITQMFTQIQSNLCNQTNLISKNVAFRTQSLVAEMMVPLQSSLNNQSNLISKSIAFRTQSLVAEMMAPLQNSLNNQSNLISKSIAFNTESLGITRMMAKFQNDLGKRLRGIDFSNIKINENGTIDYLDETINIEDVVDEVNSYLLEDISTEDDVERNTGYSEKYSIMSIIYVFLFILFASIYPKTYSPSSADTSIEQQVEYLEKLDESIVHGFNEVIKFILCLCTLPKKFGGVIDDIETKHGGQYSLMFFVLPYIVEIIYNLVKKKRESSIYSVEVLNDKKRTMKLIKEQIKISIKDEFKSEMINQIFHDNFGIVNKESLNVKTGNNSRSPIIYKLSLGETVKIIEGNRDWTKIQFDGKDNCSYMGWVFTIYIDRVD
ncbi:SH3 domain-containing protein [Clostridium estertheticum]|uniref:SH3 domain-containing protein n=1 Tax=Clostridium estertheticum TaxID=238834 RepID=UPI001C0C5760|nr:SH3 domain-containing protein [Clostridium estertheticum]MBU3176677.1 SH3 domain-containing protein [Clostridium estertheticum]